MHKKKLKLIIQPKIINHLGIKMYQNPVDVISELVANAWDADAKEVEVEINNDIKEIKIKDNGIGMSFDECQNYYLNVGRDRRKELSSDESPNGRPVLGRKGIGKFACFGIAETITISTVSSSQKQKTVFKMDINRILEQDKVSEKDIEVLEYEENFSDEIGTLIKLSLNKDVQIDIDDFITELSKRFLLPQISADFIIKVNGKILPDNFSDEMEYIFPDDLTDDEKKKFNINKIENGWAEETFDDFKIYWRIGFFEDTIKTKYLRGISIFSRGKIAQKPFFFDLSGGISGQNALEYMTGQVKMDFIDSEKYNLILTERQRIKLEPDLQEWGQTLVKTISQIWKERRSNKRLQMLEDKISGFKDRLERLPFHERKTVKNVLKKIAGFPRLGKNRFHDWCNDILTSWEKGRLKDLINEMSEAQNLDENKFIEIMQEADILTSLNIAEAVKTKIVAIGELKQYVKAGEYENKIRDFIYEKPWIIHPKWEQFKKEKSVKKIIEAAAEKELKDDVFNGRIDMALSSGESLLLLEFMRPKLKLDRDHLERINYYTIEINAALNRQTGGTFKKLEKAYVIADDYKNNIVVNEKVKQLERENILFITWDTLIEQSIKQWEEFLELLKERHPKDKRIMEL